MDTFVEDLNNNPIFQLSLSSKELFHSNFLAWLAEDKNTRNLFNELMRVWLNDSNWEFNDEEMMVKREYKNFDFCICKKICNYHTKKEEDEEQECQYLPGAIIFVLENKFKSLPYKEQLETYHERVMQLNIQGLKDQEKTNKKKTRLENNWAEKNDKLIKSQNSKTRYVLLTLADNILDNTDDANSSKLSFTTTKTVTNGKTEFTDRAEWKIINYKQYSNILSQLNEDEDKKLWNNVKNKSFYQELINKYCKFIETFSNHITSCLTGITNEEENTINKNICWNILTNHQEFYEIRCYDIWQKLVMYKCAKELVSKLDSKFAIDYNSSDKHIWEEKENCINEGKEKLYIGIGFFHGEAFLEFKYLMPNDAIFCLQQQGNNTLSVGLVVKGKDYRTPKNGKNDSEWDKKVIEIIGDKFPKGIEYQDNKYYSYQGDYCSFFYYHLNEKEVELQEIKNKTKDEKYLSISKTLQKMKGLMDKATEKND